MYTFSISGATVIIFSNFPLNLSLLRFVILHPIEYPDERFQALNCLILCLVKSNITIKNQLGQDTKCWHVEAT